MDHPTTSDPARFQKVEIKNSCFRILGYEWDGNNLKGVCETLANTPGKDMRALIVENGIQLGFSLRALGKTKVNPTTGITEVHSPMKVFCYDLVSNPSHAKARMTEVVQESQIIVPNSSQMEALSESTQLTALAESYGFDIETLGRNENLVVDPEVGLAMLRMNSTTLKAFLEEDVLKSFVSIKRKYFL